MAALRQPPAGTKITDGAKDSAESGFARRPSPSGAQEAPVLAESDNTQGRQTHDKTSGQSACDAAGPGVREDGYHYCQNEVDSVEEIKLLYGSTFP